MATPDEMLSKLVESVRTAHDAWEADEALKFASGYVRALDDFALITADQSAATRKLLLDTRQAWSGKPRIHA
ncbi:hypothetical protein ACFFYR_33275 [Paraburkholderia dipogonis]|uniref:hypothetical protein n=1 Tax=Paraburkholderia dipogonis TaxID=1211383 RepID=UPI0035EC945D